MGANREGASRLSWGTEFYLILLWLTAMGIKPLILLRFQKWLASKLRVGHSPEKLTLIHSMIASGAFHLQLTGARFAFAARKPETLTGCNRSVQFRRSQ